MYGDNPPRRIPISPRTQARFCMAGAAGSTAYPYTTRVSHSATQAGFPSPSISMLQVCIS